MAWASWLDVGMDCRPVMPIRGRSLERAAALLLIRRTQLPCLRPAFEWHCGWGEGRCGPCPGQVHVPWPWGWPCAPLPSAPLGCWGASCPSWCGLEVPIGALWCVDVAWVATGAAYLR